MLLAEVALAAISAIAELITFVLLGAVVMVPCWLIAKKAGYPGWASLLLLIPFANVAAIWIFACSAWPSLKQRETARRP
jgi:hypothetical protein